MTRRRAVAPVASAPDGLVPAVVQDAADGRVLMVAYMDAEALAATLATGEVHFHSRSRDRLWRKGETSGNVLRLVDLAIDCDGDALLVTVDPVGPTCHRGTRELLRPRRRARRARRPRGSPGSRRCGRRSPTRAAERPAGSYTTSPARRRRRRRRPQGHRGGDRGAARRQGRRAAEAAGADRAATRDGAGRRGRRPAVPRARAARRARPRPADGHRRRCAAATATSARAGASLATRGRPISRRRLPIRTSSHSPAIGSGTSAGSVTRVAVDRHAAARDHPARLAPRGEDARPRPAGPRPPGRAIAGSNVNPPVDS